MKGFTARQLIALAFFMVMPVPSLAGEPSDPAAENRRLLRAKTYLAEHYRFSDNSYREQMLGPGGLTPIRDWPFEERCVAHSFYVFVTRRDHPGAAMDVVAVDEEGGVLFPSQIDDFNALLRKEEINLGKLSNTLMVLRGYLRFFHISRYFDIDPTDIEDPWIVESIDDIGFPDSRRGRRRRNDIERRYRIGPPAIEFEHDMPVYRFFTWTSGDGALRRHRLYFSETGVLDYKVETLAQMLGDTGGLF